MSRRMDKRRTTRIKPRRQRPGKALIIGAVPEHIKALGLSEEGRKLFEDCLRKSPKAVAREHPYLNPRLLDKFYEEMLKKLPRARVKKMKKK